MKADELVRAADLVQVARGYGLDLEKEGPEWVACCPFHQEETPSWKIFRGRDGKQRYECFGCQAKGDVLDLIKHMEHLADTKAALAVLQEMVGGVAPTPGPRPVAPGASAAGGKKPKRKTKPGRELAVYDYHDAAGAVRFQVVRKELIDSQTGEVVGKTFLQRHKVHGETVWNLDGIERVLYRLPAVMRADRVWLVEGEKDVHTLEALGLVATTIPGGAKAQWVPSFTAALSGRQVVLCGDNDKPGQEHIARCAHELRDAAKLFKATMPEGSKDVSVFIAEQGHALADLEALVEPLTLPARVVEFPSAPSASAGPRGNGGPGGGGAGGDGGGGGDLPPDGSAGPDPRWESFLLRTREMTPRPLLANVIIALRLAPEWHGVLRLNEFSLEVVATRAFPGRPDVPAGGIVWTDNCDVLLTNWLQHHGISASIEIVGRAVQAVAEDRRFHPVREYLTGLKWDGTERIDHWLVDHAGAVDSPYVRAVGSRWLISAVARIMQPGCKADCCLILESAHQGAGKSTTVKTLGDPWTTDDMSEMGGKDSAIQTMGVWLVELSELDSMRRAEQGRVKAFMSRSTDRYRPPYGRRAVAAPRQCVFVGTVNHAQYLPDETGGRRFWPVTVPHEIDIEGLRAAKDLLWAEAYAKYKQGARWWLDDMQLKRAAEIEQRARYEADPWEPRIAEWLSLGRKETSVEVLLESCIIKPLKDWTQQDKNRVARALRSLGWERFQTREEGRRVWKYRPMTGYGQHADDDLDAQLPLSPVTT